MCEKWAEFLLLLLCWKRWGRIGEDGQNQKQAFFVKNWQLLWPGKLNHVNENFVVFSYKDLRFKNKRSVIFLWTEFNLEQVEGKYSRLNIKKALPSNKRKRFLSCKTIQEMLYYVLACLPCLWCFWPWLRKMWKMCERLYGMPRFYFTNKKLHEAI